MATTNNTALTEADAPTNWFAEMADWLVGEANGGDWLVFSDPFSKFAFVFARSDRQFHGLASAGDRDFSRFSIDEFGLMDTKTYTTYEVV